MEKIYVEYPELVSALNTEEEEFLRQNKRLRREIDIN